MRILFLSSVFPQPGAPTRGIYSLQLCKALSAQHQVRVIAPQSWLEKLRVLARSRQQSADGDARPAGLEVDYPCYYYPPKFLRSTHAWLMWAAVRRRVCRLAARFSPDFILSYWAYPDGAMAVRAARFLGVPAAVMVGGSDVLLLASRPAWRRRILNVLQGADTVLAVGQDLKARIVELGVEPSKVHVVLRGVNLDLFTPGDRRKARLQLGIPAEGRMLLWVGRMVPVKGLEVLLEACACLRDCGMMFHLYLVGEGPERKALEAESAARGLAKHVTFVGAVRHEQLPPWYRAADLTVLPSRSEGVPNVLRESLACGTPFVASRAGGIPELANGGGNRLVTPGDPKALAEAISRTLAEPAPAAGLPFSAVSWAAAAESLLEVVRPLVSASSARHPGYQGANSCTS